MVDGRRKSGRVRWILLSLVVLLAVLGFLGWWKLFREVPQQLANDSMEEQFKYGSIGAENAQGMPYWIFVVLPKMFPEYLPRPGGWASLGLSYEQGRDIPVGFSKKTIGFERVAINCALCHTARVRKPGEAAPRIFPGGPGNAVDPLGYQNFLFAVAGDPRFTASNVLDQIAQIKKLSAMDRMLYRFILVPQARRALLRSRSNFDWTKSRVAWGHGRIDPFNPIKFGILRREAYGNKRIDEIDDHTIGNSDMQPIWNLRLRVDRKMAYHWDGLNTDLREVLLSSALGDGATPKSLPIESLARLQQWLEGLAPPRFEDLFPVDRGLAQTGEPIFRQHCARCHANDGERTGQLLALNDAAWSEGVDAAAPRPRHTDTHRAEMWTPGAAEAYNKYADDYPWDFKNFRSTGAYVNVPLDGLWIRAPYLHNGSVPFLAELFEAPDKRTKVFYRGLDVYDPDRMGFVSDGDEAKRVGSLYDTSKEGNGNQGHLWGIQLPPEAKRALIEYLKTL